MVFNIQSASIRVKSSFSFSQIYADSFSRRFALILFASIRMKSSFSFSQIYADFLCFTLTFWVLFSASICVKYLFFADLRWFICFHLREIFLFSRWFTQIYFLADFRGFYLRSAAWNLLFFSQIYADFICFKLAFCILLSASICVKSSFFFRWFMRILFCHHPPEAIYLSLVFHSAIGWCLILSKISGSSNSNSGQ